MDTVQVIREFLVHLPGEVERHVDLLKLAAVVSDAEDRSMPGENRYVVGMRAVVDEATAIFPDEWYRWLAVRILTIVLNTHAPAAAG